jgi:hypothetical protein
MTAAAGQTPEQRLASYIKGAAEAQLILNFQAAEPMEWVAAIDFLVAIGEFEAARFAIRQILAVRHDLPYAHNVVDVLDRIPEADAETLSFRDDLASEVQIVPRDGADAVILVFGDYTHHAGIALSIAHRWFRRLPASLVYLRDFRRLFFREGVPTLGASREATVAKLREIIRSLGAGRVLCYGNSSGGFAALYYGLDLSARKVLSLSGFSRLVFDALPRDFRANDYRSHPISKQPIDLREFYSRVANPPNALLFYGDSHPYDRAQAEHMAGIKNAKLVPVENCSTHLVPIELIRRGAFERVLLWLCEQ